MQKFKYHPNIELERHLTEKMQKINEEYKINDIEFTRCKLPPHAESDFPSAGFPTLNTIKYKIHGIYCSLDLKLK